MAYEYYLRQKFADMPQLIAAKDGERINLKGEELKEKIAATESRPAWEKVTRGATQKDLKELYEDAKYGDFSKIIARKEKQPAKAK